MSFGFSVGDFLAGIQLCKDIIITCTDNVGALKSHQDFKNAASGLKVGLQNLVDVIEEKKKKAGNDNVQHPNDEATWKALRQITLDIRATLETIRKRLKQYPVDENSGLGRKMRFWLGPQDEIKELIDRCQYHIATVNFILEPFKM